MRRISAAKFQEQCLALLDNLPPLGLVITKRGKPVARVIPYPPSHPRTSRALIGSLRGKIEIHGDILSTGIAWAADPDPH